MVAGSCDGRGESAPFLIVAKQPYLKPHHNRRLADGGLDHPGGWQLSVPRAIDGVHHGVEEWNQAIAWPSRCSGTRLGFRIRMLVAETRLALFSV